MTSWQALQSNSSSLTFDWCPIFDGVRSYSILEKVMRLALVNNCLIEPQPKLKGVCPHCKSETYARCGEIRSWHWAHKGAPACAQSQEEEKVERHVQKNESSYRSNGDYISDVCTKSDLNITPAAFEGEIDVPISGTARTREEIDQMQIAEWKEIFAGRRARRWK
ncbi:competence protein CoiA family protein [Micavibrio aeruginosavorus]|uniref:competence protein CoiA family protein n=1 Tax=Micavibrio aeruginosavorus TaxID=349221 RepID=UPI003F4AB4D3